MGEVGKSIILIGIILVIVGVVMTVAGKIPGAGKLPGDILVKRENFSFYFPLTTCILISILFSVIMHFFRQK